MKNYQSFPALPEGFKFTRHHKTPTEKELENFKKEKDLAINLFLKISEIKKSEVVPPRALLRMDYVFCNPNVNAFLLENDSCDKYAVVYAYHSEYGLHKEVIPEAYVVDGEIKERPIKMMDLLSDFVSRRGEISHIAVLKETYFKDKEPISKLFIYHFDYEKFELEKQKQLKLGLSN